MRFYFEHSILPNVFFFVIFVLFCFFFQNHFYLVPFFVFLLFFRIISKQIFLVLLFCLIVNVMQTKKKRCEHLVTQVVCCKTCHKLVLIGCVSLGSIYDQSYKKELQPHELIQFPTFAWVTYYTFHIEKRQSLTL